MQRYTFRYNGSGFGILGHVIIGSILTAITLGIYTPWYITSLIRYVCENVVGEGTQGASDVTVVFNGSGADLLGRYLGWWVLLIITLGLYTPWMINGFYRYIVENITVQGSVVRPEAQAVASMSRLVVRDGPQAGQSFALSGAIITVGRSPDNTIVLTDNTVSRHHARIIRQRSDYYLEDLGSTSGTILNQTRVQQPGRLTPGSVIRFGDSVLSFEASANVPNGKV